MSAIGNTPSTAATAQSGSTSVTNPNATIGKDGFLKMFVAQMQNQDPSSSQDPNESTQQMAMFSMVEQMTNLVMQEQTVSQQLSTQSAVGLIGHTVSYTDTSGNLQETLNGFNFSNAFNVVPAHIALKPSNRTGFVDGPSTTVSEIQSFTY